MNEEIKIVIPVAPITKKNHQMIVVNPKTKRPMVMPSKEYRAYEKEAGKYLAPLKKYHVDYPANVKCIYYMKTRRSVDLTNLLEATDDVLVKYGILEDDNSKVVAGHDGSRVKHDKDFPRTEVYITRMEEV